MRSALATLLLCGLGVMTQPGHADDTLPRNYLAYSDSFASAGQPSAAQLKQLADAGLERVIYIAYSDHDGSLANEDRIVKSLGLDYVHIPVEWTAPTRGDYEQFAAAMRAAPDKRTLLHCQANFRASAFALLYRVLEQDIPLAQAKADMNQVWTPTPVWNDLVLSILRDNGVDSDCEGCDWTPHIPE
ncbi:MAG: protein tyrosine phosphatase family protein [Pseudomonadota bacterium]